MAQGQLSSGRSSGGPQPALCAPKRAQGHCCLLSLACRQHRMTSHFPCPFAIAARVLWRYFGASGYFGIVLLGNMAKNRTAPSWRDPQSSETLRSNMNQVRIQQNTGVCKGGGMTLCHHTCDRWFNLMPLFGGQAEQLRDICELTDGFVPLY